MVSVLLPSQQGGPFQGAQAVAAVGVISVVQLAASKRSRSSGVGS